MKWWLCLSTENGTYSEGGKHSVIEYFQKKNGMLLQHVFYQISASEKIIALTSHFSSEIRSAMSVQDIKMYRKVWCDSHTVQKFVDTSYKSFKAMLTNKKFTGFNLKLDLSLFLTVLVFTIGM